MHLSQNWASRSSAPGCKPALSPAQAAAGQEAPLGSPLPAGLAALMDLLPCLLRKLQVAADRLPAACCPQHSDICTEKAQHMAHERLQ